MTTLREAAQQALEALEEYQEKGAPFMSCDAAVAALRAALAEPVQEPFGYLWPTGRHPEFRFTQQKRDGVDGTPIYTTPPQRKPLTEPLPFGIEERAGVRVLYSKDGSCRPATAEEWLMWEIISAAINGDKERAHGIEGDA